MSDLCRKYGHYFPSKEEGIDIYPEINDQCRRCGIKYCPVAYDHFDPDLDRCMVCGAESEYEYGG